MRAGDLLAADVLVRMPNGRYESLSLHQASAAQIEQAARTLEHNKRARSRDRLPREWKTRAARLAERLPQAPPGTRSRERVRLSRARDGSLTVSFNAIPVDALGAFVDVLRQELEREG